MDFKKYLNQIKKDTKRMWAGGGFLDRKYILQMFALFAVNLIGIVLIVIMKENFPVEAFFVVFAFTALAMINISWKLFKRIIKKSLPYSFENEKIKYGAVIENFRCALVFLGKAYFRGIYCQVYVYKKVLLIKFWNNCLVIDDDKYLTLEKTFMGYRLEFEKDKIYVCCRLNEKQFEIINKWIADIEEQKRYWSGE